MCVCVCVKSACWKCQSVTEIACLFRHRSQWLEQGERERERGALTQRLVRCVYSHALELEATQQ